MLYENLINQEVSADKRMSDFITHEELTKIIQKRNVMWQLKLEETIRVLSKRIDEKVSVRRRDRNVRKRRDKEEI